MTPLAPRARPGSKEERLSAFLTEAAEALAGTERVDPETGHGVRAALDGIARLVAAVQASCGPLRLRRLEALAEAGETLLSAPGDGASPFEPEAAVLALQWIDRCRELLSHLELVGVEPEGEDRDLIASLKTMGERRLALARAAPPARPSSPPPAPSVEPTLDHPRLDLSWLDDPPKPEPAPRAAEPDLAVAPPETPRRPEARNRAEPQPQAPDAPAEMLASEPVEKTVMLLVRAGDGAPKAVPLALVTRLDDIPAECIERSAGGAVAHHRGKLMPLILAAPDQTLARQGSQPVLVFAEGERLAGLAVDEIEDIVEEVVTLQPSTAREGVLGSAVLKGRPTEVLDIGAHLAAAFASGGRPDRTDGRPARPRLLLVEGGAFFRNMAAPLLTASGYEVTTAASVEEARRLHGHGEAFDAIVADVDAPGVDGVAQELMEESRWAGAARIALSGLPVEQALSRAPAGAFAGVVRRSDRQGLIERLEQVLRPDPDGPAGAPPGPGERAGAAT